MDVASGVELRRVECTMARAKEIAIEDCTKIESTIELRAINKEMNRVERLAYYYPVYDVDGEGNLNTYIKEEANWHPYASKELMTKGGDL